MSDSAKPPKPTRPPPPLPKKREAEPSLLELEPDPDPDPEPVVPPPTPSMAETKIFESPLAPTRARVKDRPWFLPAVGGGGALCLLVLLFASVKAACGSSSRASTVALTSSTTQASAAVVAPPPPPLSCALAGNRRSIAPRALAASGLEVATLGSEIAVGFATSPNDGKIEVVDPTTGATATSVLARSNDPIRRVLALSRTSATLDVDRKKDPLRARRTILSDPPVDVGGTEDGFGWAPHKTDKAVKLWALPQSGVAVEQVRGDALPDGRGFAIAFRQANVVYAGAFGGTPLAPLGPLVHVDGLGRTGGAPVIAASGDRVMIAWSDRATASEPWHLRTATFRVGEDAVQPHAFAAPAGGLGEQTMSPDLTSLGKGRFLLLWTEGLATHQVRGAVLGDEGAPTSAFAVSPDGADAGQGQAAVLDDGRGVVAYLSATAPGFYEAMTAPLKCVER